MPWQYDVEAFKNYTKLMETPMRTEKIKASEATFEILFGREAPLENTNKNPNFYAAPY
jgi:hypothetical protein